MSGSIGIRDYATEQMNHLLTKVAFQVHRTAKKPGSDEIHDLRVSIRRFSQGLLLFSEFCPEWEVKKINKQLKSMMQLTSEIRNRDIALEFLAKYPHTNHRDRLEQERSSFERQFSEMARRWSARDFSAKWRDGLSLRGV
jgi:CHAD domain-containing protein